MTQFKRLLARQPYLLSDQRLMLCALILGSLAGALWASLAPAPVSAPDATAPAGSLLLIWLRCALFPCLLAGSMVFGNGSGIPVLFFLKGAFTAFTICAYAVQLPKLAGLLPTLLLETVLPLPWLLWLGAVWYRQAKLGQARLLLLIPALLLSLFLAVLKLILA